jgi:TetR/AcrR family fatty acid metabolism transcriptional regulator
MEMVKEETRSKRQAIIEAARNIFAMKGYEDTTIAEIAEEAGVAVGTVYLYFHNKREIYTSVSLDQMVALAAVMQDPRIVTLPFEQVPRAMIEAIFRICHQNSRLMSLFKVDIQSQEEIQQHKAAEALITNALDNFLRQAIVQGQLAPFDTEMYAKILFGLVDSALYDCFCVESGEGEERYRERTIEIIERLFFGPSIREGTKDNLPIGEAATVNKS